MMEVFNDQMIGPVVLDRDLMLNGQVVGDLTVPDGIVLQLNGQVSGNLIVESGGSAVVYGMVVGKIINAGIVELNGVALGGVVEH